jgi:hypothetical protein
MTRDPATVSYDRASAHIRALLDGKLPLNGSDDFPECYLGPIQTLTTALEQNGREAVRKEWNRLVDDDPELADLVSQENDESEFARAWRRNLVDFDSMVSDSSPRDYIIDDVLHAPSLSIMSGHPGHFKSMLAADMAVSVAADVDFLTPAPDVKTTGFKTSQRRVLWVDLDQGADLTRERFAAIANARELKPVDISLDMISMPEISLDIGNPMNLQEFAAFVIDGGYGLVVVDSLNDARGGIDENSPDMGTALGDVRRLVCEPTGAAVIVIHHLPKDGGTGNRYGTSSPRGSGAIQGKADLTFVVRRKDNIVEIETTKSRVAPVPTFSAEFSYSSSSDGCRLESAQFTRIERVPRINSVEIDSEILQHVGQSQPINRGALTKSLQDSLPGTSERECGGRIDALVGNGQLIESKGSRNARLYSLPNPEADNVGDPQ